MLRKTPFDCFLSKNCRYTTTDAQKNRRGVPVGEAEGA